MKRFNPRTLFAASEPGAWYDPSDLSTLFQDEAGTTPVTAVEQPVGRILDKSGRGNHATQATTTKRPILSRRVNTFTRSEFQDGSVGGGGLVSIASLAGYAGAVSFGHNGVTSSYAYKSASHLNGFSAILSFVIQMTDGGLPVTNRADAVADFMLVVNGGAYTDASVVSLGGGFYRIISQPTVITASNTGVVKYNTNSSRTFKVTAYDLRLATDAHLPYQWVNATDYDADPNKFPAYLACDGIDDAMVTVNIDFTGTDKMTVWAGVTKLSDAAPSMLLESSDNTNNNSGSFYITAPESPGTSSFDFKSRGSLHPTPVNLFGHAAPLSRVVTALGDIGGDVATIRAGGTSNTSTQDQGTGSYGNYPLYIGARAGTSLYFNGRLYSLIVRGAQSSLSQIEVTEAYIKQKMRLP